MPEKAKVKNMEFKMKKAEVVNVTKKVSMVKTDTYQLVLSTREALKDGTYLCTASACDGNAQATISLIAQIEEPIEEPVVVYVGAEFISICNILAEQNHDYIFRVEDALSIICGEAHTTIPLKTEGKSLNPEKTEETISVKMKSQLLKEAIVKGGYCVSKENNRGLKNVFGFIMKLSDKKNLKLRCYTTDMYVSSVCTVPVIEADKLEKENITYGLACDRMMSLVGNLQEEETQIFLNKGQVVFRNGNDFYIFRAFENNYPDTMEQYFEKQEFACTLEIPVKEFETAITLASLTNEESKPVVLKNDNGVLAVTDRFGNTSTRIEVSMDGTFDLIGCRGIFLKTAIGKIGQEKIWIGIDGATSAIYLWNEDVAAAIAMIAPQKLDA